jgi:integrase/recombinase XerC
MTTHQSQPPASAADLEAAHLLLSRLGVSPADLLTGSQNRAPAPTFAEYIPIVSDAVTDGTRRIYGSYWNRILEHWGSLSIAQACAVSSSRGCRFTHS